LNKEEVTGDWLDLGKDNKMHSSSFTKKIEPGKKYITGEATATTHTSANPRLVKLFLPKVKLLFLLRDPSERFISHYNMLCRFHEEGRKGYDLGNLDSFIDKEIDAYNSGQTGRIISQGMYMNEMPEWEKNFGKNLRLYKTTDLKSSTANNTMNEICNYLNIEAHNFNPVLKTQFNSTSKKIERTTEYQKLQEFYAPQVTDLKVKYGLDLNS